MIEMNDTLAIGKFHKTHALKGELNAILEIDPEYFEQGNPLIVETEGILVPFFIETIRPKGSTSFLIKIAGIDSELQAREFVNKEIRIKKDDAENWLEDFSDIGEENFRGYNIIDADSEKKIGVVEDINDETANLLFIVDTGEDSIMIPASDDLITEIDDDGKMIYMRLPDGLLEINSSEGETD